MVKASREDRESRTERLPVMLTKTERAKLDRAAQEEGLPTSSFVRSKALEAAKHIAKDE